MNSHRWPFLQWNCEKNRRTRGEEDLACVCVSSTYRRPACMLHVLYSLLVPNYEKQKSPSHYKKRKKKKICPSEKPDRSGPTWDDELRAAPRKLWVEKRQEQHSQEKIHARLKESESEFQTWFGHLPESHSFTDEIRDFSLNSYPILKMQMFSSGL